MGESAFFFIGSRFVPHFEPFNPHLYSDNSTLIRSLRRQQTNFPQNSSSSTKPKLAINFEKKLVLLRTRVVSVKNRHQSSIRIRFKQKLSGNNIKFFLDLLDMEPKKNNEIGFCLGIFFFKENILEWSSFSLHLKKKMPITSAPANSFFLRQRRWNSKRYRGDKKKTVATG